MGEPDMYLYETHCHTRTASACSRLSADDIIEVYTKNGYTGVFITDHFLNGNTAVDRSLPYAAQIHDFCRGFREVKERAAGRLQVFFGLEYSFNGTDILVYGWEEAQLALHEEFMDVPFPRFGDYCAEHGLLAVYAHPFRSARTVEEISVPSNLAAIETFNAARTELCNSLGAACAERDKKIGTGGSDLHARGQKLLSGLGFREKLVSERDFIERVLRREGSVLKLPNILA